MFAGEEVTVFAKGCPEAGGDVAEFSAGVVVKGELRAEHLKSYLLGGLV